MEHSVYCCPPLLEVLSTPEWIGLHDPASGDSWQWTCQPDMRLLYLLEQFREPLSQAEATARTRKYFNTEAEGLVSVMIDMGLLIPIDSSAHPREVEALREWAERGWDDAARLHTHLMHLPMRDYSDASGYREDFDGMAEKVAADPIPNHYKEYPRAPRVPLLRPDGDFLSAPLETAFASRAVTNTASLDKAELGRLLWLALGQTGSKELAVTGAHVTKTSPSGGARHPTEGYVIVVDVPGLAPGAYHYNVREHSLELLTEGDFEEFIRRHIVVIRGRAPSHITCSVVYTTIFERSMHRYRESKSYRVMHFDIGHLFGTTHAILRQMGLPFFSGYAVKETPVEALLGLDGLTESAMAHTTLGKPDAV